MGVSLFWVRERKPELGGFGPEGTVTGGAKGGRGGGVERMKVGGRRAVGGEEVEGRDELGGEVTE